MNTDKRKKWIVKATTAAIESSPTVAGLTEQLGIRRITAQLLVNRGCETPEKARRFLSKDAELLHDPYLMKDMDKAAARIVKAIENKEKTVIFGDYDVDGVTSVCILYLYLKKHGVDISYYIPSRSGEGYGMSEGAIKRFAEDGISLIITVDTGITAVSEAKYAGELGLDIIITDHHECHCELPDAYALINPRRSDCQYPFTELAGVGVVYKVLCAVEFALHPERTMAGCVSDISREYADLVAIGTVADVMPIKDENRLIVSYGLRLMENDMRPGLFELLEASKGIDKRSSAAKNIKKTQTHKKMTSSLIGYTIAPRINAAGRIANASIAVDLFLAESNEKAREVADTLCGINRRRQIEENKIADEAFAKISSCFNPESDSVIVLDDEKWHHGIIGIVASRFTEKYDCPCILISFENGSENDCEPSGEDIGKGSGRSIHGLNLVDALTSCTDLLVKFGGHELAAGLTLKRKNLPEFKRRINEYAKEHFGDNQRDNSICADCEIDTDDVTLEQAGELYALEPFGVSNPVPVFAAKSYTIVDIVPVGGDRHSKFILRKKNQLITAMFFCAPTYTLDLYPGDCVDLLCNLDINDYQNTRSVQFIIRDIRLCEVQYREEMRQRKLYTDILNGIIPINPFETVPERDDFATVYNLLKRELRLERDLFTMRSLLHLLNSDPSQRINYIKLKFIIRVFEELNLIGVDCINEDSYKFKYVYVKTKTSLDKSGIYKKLRGLYFNK